MEDEYKLYRVNTKIPGELNDWLDQESKRTGMSKSSLIMLAIQTTYDQKTMMKRMGDMGQLASKIDEIVEAIERNETK